MNFLLVAGLNEKVKKISIKNRMGKRLTVTQTQWQYL